MALSINGSEEKSNRTVLNSAFFINESERWTYILAHRGMQRQPLDVAIPLTVINVLIFISGFLGNIAVCIVIIKHPTLHTATNYYLFNLAVSDLTLLIFGLPNDVAIYWHQYPWMLGDSFCKVRALLSEMATYVSVLTIVAFSTERYLAICHPLYSYTMSGFQRAVKIIISLWILSFLSALPFSFYTGVNYLFYPPNSTVILMESAYCGMLSQPAGVPLIEFSTFVFFIIPMIAIAGQYLRMAQKIALNSGRLLSKGLKGSVHRESRRVQTNRTVIRMLIAVVIGFFMCWAPFHAQRLLIIYGSHTEYFHEINAWMFVITGIFYYLSSTLNPILYNIMSDRMRNAFKEIICGYPKVKRSSTQRSTLREHTRSCQISFQRSPSNVHSMDDEINLIKTETVTLTSHMRNNKIINRINLQISDDIIERETSI